jgi:hypothetical protein
VDLDAYRADAEAFVSAIDREHYLHYSGRKPSLEIEPVYEAHPALFAPAAVEALRASGNRALLEFAAQGMIGRATRAEAEELAEREASAEVEVEGQTIPFRQAAVAQANEPDPGRRGALEGARNDVVERELNPLLLEVLERSHAKAVELGWPTMSVMCAELSGIDLERLAAGVAALIAETEDSYEEHVEPELERQLGLGFAELRRSDLPAFFRAPSLDSRFPSGRLLRSLEETLDGLGVDAGGRVIVDAESRPTKSPRAFCAPVRVPDEVYLVISPHGGRDDYESLLHEAGHAYHYGHASAALPFEDRYLGDNSITEGFAFLFQRLVAEPEWLGRRLDIDDPSLVAEHARAAKLVFLRRYAAKLAYELDLHRGTAPLADLRATYARRLSEAVHVEWPSATWLSDVDPFFYAARYLRAWALEARVSRALRERFGDAWFDEPQAGALLKRLWARGQGIELEELLAEVDVRRDVFDTAGEAGRDELRGEPELAALLAELKG